MRQHAETFVGIDTSKSRNAIAIADGGRDGAVRYLGEVLATDAAIRKLVAIRHVKDFTIFLRRSPDTAEGEDLRAFQLHQRENRVQPPTMNSTVAALRFFFATTCDRPEMAHHLRLVKQPQKLPVVLTTEEVLLLLGAAPGPKYKADLAKQGRASRTPDLCQELSKTRTG